MGDGFAAILSYFYVAKNHIHFYSQNLEKKQGFGKPRLLQKTLIFSSFGGHFLTKMVPCGPKNQFLEGSGSMLKISMKNRVAGNSNEAREPDLGVP